MIDVCFDSKVKYVIFTCQSGDFIDFIVLNS